MKCKAIIFNQRKIGRCPHDAVKGKHFCSSHKYYLLVIIISPVILFMLGYLGNKLLDVIFVSDSSPFVANIQIVDWNGEINNRDIKEELYYGATLYLDNNPQKLSGSIVKFSDLPASYNKKDVRVHFEPKPEYQFMQLDTIICINRNSPTYRLRMRFKGVDKITRQVIDSITKQPVIGAIVEIEGVKDTTNNNGEFTIELPLPKQKRYQELTISKSGYKDYKDSKVDMTLNNPIIIWHLKDK